MAEKRRQVIMARRRTMTYIFYTFSPPSTPWPAIPARLIHAWAESYARRHAYKADSALAGLRSIRRNWYLVACFWSGTPRKSYHFWPLFVSTTTIKLTYANRIIEQVILYASIVSARHWLIA